MRYKDISRSSTRNQIDKMLQPYLLYFSTKFRPLSFAGLNGAPVFVRPLQRSSHLNFNLIIDKHLFFLKSFRHFLYRTDFYESIFVHNAHCILNFSCVQFFNIQHYLWYRAVLITLSHWIHWSWWTGFTRTWSKMCVMYGNESGEYVVYRKGLKLLWKTTNIYIKVCHLDRNFLWGVDTNAGTTLRSVKEFGWNLLM